MSEVSEVSEPRTDQAREKVGAGGDPVDASPARPREGGAGVVLDCGWGRLVFGQTFARPQDVADVLRAEAEGSRDICIYLADPHVLVARRPDELFIDPSLTFRLDLRAGLPDEGREVPGVVVRPLEGEDDAEQVNGIYTRNAMVTAPVDVLVANAREAGFVHLVAQDATGRVVGTVTGVDHVEVLRRAGASRDPEGGTSLWCLTVDPQVAPPGTGQALLLDLADRLAARGRAWVDLSVLADNEGAIRFYQRLGFVRTPTLCVKRKNPINERLFLPTTPDGYDGLNPYARIIADEAMRRGIRVEVTDPAWGELRLTHGGRTLLTRESLSELTSAVAMSRCDDKRVTRRILGEAGLAVARGRTATGDEGDSAFLGEVGRVVVKPARGEQGRGITVGVDDVDDLFAAVELAERFCPDVLIEEMCPGEDLRVLVVDHEVVAAAVRRPATVVADGVHDVTELVARHSRRRAAATGGESRIPLDDTTRDVVAAAGWAMTDVPPQGEVIQVRRTANLHTGGTIHDVTPDLHPELVAACVAASRAIGIPVTGLDLLVESPSSPSYVFVEANERPGLANHEPQPVVEKFVDLLFPGTKAPPRLWQPAAARENVDDDAPTP